MRPVVRFVLLSLFTFSAAHANVANLVAHYPFDGNANDVSKGANHGTEQGAIDYVPGVFGLAARFDAEADRVVLATPLPVNGTDFTLALWIQSSDTSNYLIHSWGPGSGGPAASFLLTMTPPPAGYFAVMLSKQPVLIVQGQQYTDLQLSQGWHHIAVTRRVSSGDWALYVDGLVVDTGTGGTESPADGTSIGHKHPSFTNSCECAYNGLVDDLRLYDRALSQQEIQSIMLAGNIVPTVSEYGLIAMIGCLLIAGVILARRAPVLKQRRLGGTV